MRKSGFSIILFTAVLICCGAAGSKGHVAKAKKDKVYGHLDYVKDEELSKIKGKKKLLEVVALAEKDQAGLLKKAVEHYKKNVKDYTGKFIKQERIKGKLLKEQEIDFKFRQKPFSVLMEIKKNAMSSDKVLFVKGKNEDKMVAHPIGLLSFLNSVKRAPDCKAALTESLYPCTMFGFYNMIEKAAADNAKAKKAGDLQLKYLGVTKVGGRYCVAGERVLPKKKGYDDFKLIVQIDIERLVPVDVRSFGWKEELIFKYTFKDLKFNVGLGDKDFDVKECGL